MDDCLRRSNRAFAFGNGNFVSALNIDASPTTPGNNIALALGNGNNSIAFSSDLVTPAIPAGQIAIAIGDNKNAANGTNNL